MNFTFIIHDVKVIVTADSIESAKSKVANLLDWELSEVQKGINNNTIEIFEL